MVPMTGVRAPVLLVCLALTGAPVSRGAEGRIEFLSPKDGDRAVGAVPIEVRVTPPEGSTVKKVTVSVNGRPLVTLTTPPWRTVWEAGEGLESRRIEASAALSDGTVMRAEIRTAALRVDFFERVSLVSLYAVVRNKQGQYVTDLRKDDFRLTENGQPQVIDRFSTDWKPLRVGIVLDASLSMKGGKLESAIESALDFLQVLTRGDEGLVVTFNDSVRVSQELTSDKEALAAAIRGAEAVGGTALYDAVYRTSSLLEAFDGRRVMVLLSDGRDEAANGLEPGSLHTLEEALDLALRNEVMIFSIGLGRALDQEGDLLGRESLASILTRLSESTGGRVVFSSRAGRLRKAFEEVAADLRHQYSLAYEPTNARRDGTWREIRLRTLRTDLKVSTRRGYFAATGDPPVKPRPTKRAAAREQSTRGS
jgi:VWFA-related protein